MSSEDPTQAPADAPARAPADAPARAPADLCGITGDFGKERHRERVAVLASRQSGRVARRQLVQLGIGDRLIAGWAASGYLHARLPSVYAVGHTAPSDRGALTEALLYAGPGAMLSGATAIRWLGLSGRRAERIEVSTPRQRRSLPGVLVYGRRRFARVWHRGLPVAPIPEVLLAYAATTGIDDVRYVLAGAEYHGWLDVEAITASLGHGRPGSAALRAALARHQPQLAHTRSEFERRLLALCERHRLPVPEFNVFLKGWLVDAVWRQQRVVVETDGRDGHSSWAQIQTDRERDLCLRAAGFVVLRYTWRQLTRDARAVAADIDGALSWTAPSAGRGSR